MFAFGSTSVTAAHDNYFSEVYTELFGKMMAPVFRAAGSKLESRNIALGANPIFPYAWCLQTHSGDGVDDWLW